LASCSTSDSLSPVIIGFLQKFDQWFKFFIFLLSYKAKIYIVFYSIYSSGFSG
jgi:hypothetical protein